MPGCSCRVFVFLCHLCICAACLPGIRRCVISLSRLFFRYAIHLSLGLLTVHLSFEKNENTIKNNDLCLETIKLNGSNPLVASSAIVFSNETLTAIAGLTVAQHTVALVGTANGHLKKVSFYLALF